MTWDLSGHFTRPGGTPAEGYVAVSTVPAVLTNTASDVVFVSPSKVPLVGGEFTVTLPWTDDPDIVEGPFTFTIEVRLHHATLRTLTGVEVPSTVAAVAYADLSREQFGTPLAEQFAEHVADDSTHDIPGQIAAAVATIDGGTL